MRRYLVYLLVGAALVAFGCSEERVSAPTPDQGASAFDSDAQALAWTLIEEAGWPIAAAQSELGDVGVAQCHGHHAPLFGFERTHIIDDIYHYSMEVRVGHGPHEVIGLHRVVKEERPHRPICTPKTLFCLHGTPGHFEVMFLAGAVIPSAPDDHAIAVYLAQNDVDVWGIDQAYTLLPQEITDFSFMEDWGIEFDYKNLRTGMGVARLVRLITGSGRGKMNLMGYSTGFMTGLAALNAETQLPPARRHIAGYIPVDFFYKTDIPIWQQSECDYLPAVEELLDAGIYQNDFGLLFQNLGYLAQSDPGGDSPIFPGLTNLDAALWAGALTGVLLGMPNPDVHYFGGVFDGQGNPIDLNYTDLTHYLEWLQQFNNYGSNVLDYDITFLHCDEGDSPHDDYLDLIDVPVFFLGANGGWGDIMDYTASLLTGSPDVTLLNVQLQSEKLLDVGHVDIYTAGVSPAEFWTPVLQWINDHAE